MMEVQRLGRVAYADALALQLRLVEDRHSGRIADQLLLLEHDEVLTVGRRKPGPPLTEGSSDLPIFPVSRGGEMTWHGPGQLVGYWIRALVGPERDLHRHLHLIEEALLRALAPLGVSGRREPGKTGVWVGPRKIASIGVAVRNWVTYHGFALNLSVDSRVWQGFRPCGLEGAVMTDLRSVLGREIDPEGLVPGLINSFRTVSPS